MKQNSVALELPTKVLKRTALFETQDGMGAAWEEHFGWEAAVHFGSPEEEAMETRGSVGLADWGWMPKFELKGLGLSAPPEAGASSRYWRLGRGHYLVTCEIAVRQEVKARLDTLGREGINPMGPPSFHVTDVTSAYASLLLAGPRTKDLLRKVLDVNLADTDLADLSSVQTGLAHVHAIVLRKDIGPLGAYLLLTGREYGEWAWETVIEAGKEFAIRPFGLRAHRLLSEATQG